MMDAVREKYLSMTISVYMCDREINRGWKVVEGMLYVLDSHTGHRCAVHAVGAGRRWHWWNRTIVSRL
jgi:hypothetical protein